MHAAQQRSNLTSQFAETIDQFELLIQSLRSPTKETLLELSEMYEAKSYPKLPYIDTSRRDPKTGMKGDIAPTLTGIALKVYQQKNSLYTFDLHIDVPNPTTEDRFARYTNYVEEENVPEHDALRFLKTFAPEIEKAKELFIDALFHFELKDSRDLKSQNIALHLLKKKSENISQTEANGKLFKIPLEDMPYKKALPPGVKEVKFNLVFISTPQEASQIHSAESWSGLWQSGSLTRNHGFIGVVYAYKNVESILASLINSIDPQAKLDKIYEELADVTRHEIQHLTQTFIQHTTLTHEELKAKRDLGGGVSRNQKNPNHNAYGQPTTQGLDPSTHAHRDIEFYTDLSDNIQLFLRTRQKLPLPLHTLFAKAWVDAVPLQTFESALKTYLIKIKPEGKKSKPNNQDYHAHTAFQALRDNSYFQELKSNLPKYQKAVKEFVKAIS